jgi:superfamily I DNA/RNA helicase
VSRDLPVTVPDTDSILDTDEGRKFIALLNLLENPEDNLALRTILHIERNRIGKKSYAKIFELANNKGIAFSQAAYKIHQDPSLIPRDGNKIAGAIDFINKKISLHKKMIGLFERSIDRNEIFESLILFVEDIIPDSENKSKLVKYISTVMDETDPSDFKNLIQILSATVNEIEQAIDPEKINIMTMHKAKGLTATAVILAACEDEYIPGRQTDESEGDERRLLYVSLSRAKKFLYITYCDQRTGQQSHTGRSNGARRSLTRFLCDAPNKPLRGQKYVEKLKI